MNTDKSKYKNLISIGSQMANMCFNGKQKDRVPADFRQSMKEMQEQWDDELTRLRSEELNKEKPRTRKTKKK